VLASPDPRARAAAARIVCDWADRLDAPVELLAPAVDDPSALVRLEGVRALATLGGRRAAELALHAVDHERDDALDYAVWLTARETKDAWLPAVLDGTFADDGRFGRVIFAVAAAEASDAVPRIVALLKDGKIPDADRPAALSAIAKLGNAEQLRVVFDVVTAPATPAAQAAALLGDLLDSHRRRRVVPTGDVSAIKKLVVSPDDACSARAIEATAAWGVAAATDELAGIVESGSRSAAVRKAAIAALGGLPGDPPKEALLKLCASPKTGEEFTADAIAALVPRSAADAATQAVSFLGTARDAKPRTVVFQSFLKARDGASVLAAALDRASSPISADAAKDGQQAVSAAGRQEPALAQALAAAVARSSTGIPQPSVSAHAMNAADLESFVTLVREKADATRGAAIYARENLKCVTCHRIGEQGGRVGPNLTAIGASSPLDYVIDSLLDPAKNVKEGYNTVVVQTDDGQVLTGIQVTRSDAELVLRDATGKEIKIPTADIDEESIGTSLMPAGLIDSLSREELADLVRYLSGLGK
jgi:putative heme-binding domain-containing protein